MKRKKLAAAIAALGALQADVVSALGMGDFTLNSALNQPLEAEIRLLHVEDLDPSQVRVTLAGAEDFANAGVSRDYFLTSLDFTIELDGDGGGVVKITTPQAVIEPYLNFLIDARWPTGRMLREYTVLLDLPVFSESETQKVEVAASNAPSRFDQALAPAPVQASSAAAAAAASTPSPSVSSSLPSTSPRRTLTEGQRAPGEKYRVRTDDTLWEIASDSNPGADITVQQTMLGILRMNPQAFINGNINRLKAGAILRLPTAADVEDMSSDEAVREVANHNRMWRSGDSSAPSQQASGPQLDATTSNTESPAESSEQARLSLATAGDRDDASAGEGIGSGTGSAALRDKLDMAQEGLDKTTRDNDELQSRLNDMESKVATLQRLIELKDDQLAAMQGSAAEQQEAASRAAEVAAEMDALQPEMTAESESQEAAEDSGLDNDVGDASTEPDASDAEVQEPTKTAPPIAAPKPAPVAEPSLVDQLMDNPLYAGGAGIVILALAAALLMRRRKADEDEPEGFDFTEPEDDDFVEMDLDDDADLDLDIDEDLDESDQLAAELEQEIAADNAEEQAAPSETTSELQSETGDAIAEADIYIAYGRYQQAVDLLTTAISQEPQRSDLQVKLLEVYTETRDKPGFQQQYLALQALGDDAAIGEVKEMLSSVDGVADWLDDLPGAGTDFSDADMDADLIDGGDTDSDEEGLDLDLDLDDIESTQEAVAVDGAEDSLDLDDELDLDLGDELDLDVDLDLDGVDDISIDKTQQFEAVSLDTGSSDELDLGDLETELEPAAQNEEADLDLDLELDGASVDTETVIEEAVTEEGFDLDLDGDLDLDLGDLGDSDLDDLEAEFGDASTGSAADKSLELDIAEDLVEPEPEAEPEPAAEVPLTDSSFDEAVTVDEDEDFDFLADSDEVATKLDLARAYIDMGDSEGAKDILDEVLQEGSDEQKQEASELMGRVD